MQVSNSRLNHLNQKQRKAVISESRRVLVLAGAGSGKTQTLLQKLIYLIEEKGVNPSQILAITYTKNAANEMRDRLILSADTANEYADILASKTISAKEKDKYRYEYTKKYRWIDNLTLRTFHSLCYSIMRNYGLHEFDNQFRILTDGKAKDEDYSKYSATETTHEILHKILIESCEDRKFLLRLKRHILDYHVDRMHTERKNTTLGSYHNQKPYTSLNGTKVRSKSEQFIADYFFRNSIRFEYEPEVNVKDFTFRPDFYIPEANLYLEHVSSKSYPIAGKIAQFKKANMNVVLTHEDAAADSALFTLELDKAVKNRLPANYDFKTALTYQSEFNHYHKDVGDFRRQVLQVIDMIKVEHLPLKDIYEKAMEDPHERIRDFYKLAAPLIQKYNEYCIDKSYMDFNDMISRTISLFRKQPEVADWYREQFQYVLVDEFQDVNNLQVELITLLMKKESQLFCVGDDWQSIYGFRGSNVDYIVNFEKHFYQPEIIKLNLNYRSTQHIVGASNEVIKHNRFKVDKVIKASKQSDTKIFIFAGNEENENIAYAIKEIRRLKEELGYQKEDILFLYRRSKMYDPYYRALKKEGLWVSNKTIHGAKGLEAKAVFVIGLSDGYGGFPDIWMGDRIYQVIKETNHDMLLEEERRLFYVAITRAKDRLYLLTEKGNESRFLSEIPQAYTLRGTNPADPVMSPVTLCDHCQAQIAEQFAYCPYCGHSRQAED
ncbi:MAG: UvrD-helicase domain-containing protein [Cyclobacteriaceae bacterium]